MKIFSSLFFILFLILGSQASAQSPPANKPKAAPTSAANAPVAPQTPAAGTPAAAAAVQGQWGTVKTDNALVYEQPDFDAATLMYLPAGQKIRISKKSFGSYFKFYRVKAGQNKIGYITTIDVIPEKAAPAEKAVVAKNGKFLKKKKRSKQANGKPSTGKYPPVKAFILTKYMGIFIGNLKYQETIPGVNSTETLLVYGIKITGPHTFISLPTDFNFIIHYGAPSYYNTFSTTKASGFAMLIDWLALFPFLDKPNSSFYIGLGPLLDYSSFQFGTTAGISSSTEITLGLSAEIGYGMKLGTNWAARAEYKFMWERANYTSYGLAIQNRF